MTELKFCQEHNVEQYIWKLLFYNIIEYLRKAMTDMPDSVEQFKQLILTIIDDVSTMWRFYFKDILLFL